MTSSFDFPDPDFIYRRSVGILVCFSHQLKLNRHGWNFEVGECIDACKIFDPVNIMYYIISDPKYGVSRIPNHVTAFCWEMWQKIGWRNRSLGLPRRKGIETILRRKMTRAFVSSVYRSIPNIFGISRRRRNSQTFSAVDWQVFGPLATRKLNVPWGLRRSPWHWTAALFCIHDLLAVERQTWRYTHFGSTWCTAKINNAELLWSYSCTAAILTCLMAPSILHGADTI